MAVEVIWLTVLVVSVFSQAPQDVSSYCKDNSLVPDYPDTVKPLMDSWSYEYLLGDNGVWKSVNLDQYNESWIQVDGGDRCSQKVQVKEPAKVPQENWLITQHMSKSISNSSDLYPTVVSVNLTFIIDSDCSVSCQDSVGLFLLYSNSVINNIAERVDSFSFVANLTTSANPISKTISNSFIIQPEMEGFYLALKDYGTNVTVTRFLVYRLIGPAIQVNLTLFPETPAPTLSSTQVFGKCVANANTTSGKFPVLNLDSDGSWVHGEQCLCIEGHELEILEGTKQCQACSPSMYKALKDNSKCLNCPLNSGSSAHGASICLCGSGFFRAPSESADDQCTEPPGAPQDLRSSTPTNTTVDLHWNLPTMDGGREDLFYNVFVSTPKEPSLVQKNTDPVLNTSFFVSGLEPISFYQITVSAENGVSSQAGSENLRRATTFITTSFGVPMKVEVVYVREDGVIEWTPVNNGGIISYEVELYSDEDTGGIVVLDSTELVYVVNITEDVPVSGQPVYVRVRASTVAGPGEWSDPVVFAQINPLAPTSTTTIITTTPSHTLSSTTTNEHSTTTTSKPTSSSTTSTTSMTSVSNKPTPTNPTSNGESPVIAIVALVLAAVGIVVLVSIMCIGYFIFRQIRDKRIRRKGEETDYAPLVHYTAGGGESEDEIKVDLPGKQ